MLAFEISFFFIPQNFSAKPQFKVDQFYFILFFTFLFSLSPFSVRLFMVVVSVPFFCPYFPPFIMRLNWIYNRENCCRIKLHYYRLAFFDRNAIKWPFVLAISSLESQTSHIRYCFRSTPKHRLADVMTSPLRDMRQKRMPSQITLSQEWIISHAILAPTNQWPSTAKHLVCYEPNSDEPIVPTQVRIA